MSASLTIRPMESGERREALAVTARTLWHDPLFDFFTRDLSAPE
jgi:hypothetical protein